MAYAALLSLELAIETILPNVDDYVLFPSKKNNLLKKLFSGQKDYIHLCQKQKLTFLYENVIFLQKLLEECPKRCIPLESRIKMVAYQLEDIIESSVSGPPYMYFGSGVKILHQAQMYSAFATCTQEIDLIIEEATKIGEILERSEKPIVDSSTGNSLSGGKDTMVGLDEDLTEILDRATRQDPGLQFIPIVGMGGIGKTTLARNVFEHPLIVENFDVCSWVTVSQEFSIREILLKILSCSGQSGEDVESLILRLYQSLIGRKFLVVLDDMWHAEAWYKVKRAFPNCNNGSRIIITTRLSEVAGEIDSSSATHQMKFLNEEESWVLICENVFGQEACPQKLIDIGKTIASNCKGLPLAIVVIAGLLRVNKAQDYWREIARNVIQAATSASHDQLLGILSLSYDNLPHHMKACFLYMGVLPEDHQIPSRELIQLLVSEGFIKPKGAKSMEEVAEEYMNDLVRRNLVFFQLDPRYEKFYFIHDVLRELSIRIAQEENFHQQCIQIDEIKFPSVIKSQRRITLHHINFPFLPSIIQEAPLRGYMLYINDSYFHPTYTSLLNEFTSRFKLLKMVYGLRVREVDLSSPDSVIFQLIHLKFLGMVHIDYFHGYHRVKVNASISKLQNLQTLKMEGTQSWRILLPWNIWSMPELRHLDLIWSYITMFPDLILCRVNPNFRRCLQTLAIVWNFEFEIGAIGNLPNLKLLKIWYEYEVDLINTEGYDLNNLVHLHQLQELEFKIVKGRFTDLPKNFAFPLNLKRLTLEGCGISCEIMSVIGSLENLEVLQLLDVLLIGVSIWEPIEGEFLCLRCLQMSKLNLKKWDTEDTHFPCLEELALFECSFEIPNSIGDIPTLGKLTIDCCGEETVKSVRIVQEEQLSYGNDELQILIKLKSKMMKK